MSQSPPTDLASLFYRLTHDILFLAETLRFRPMKQQRTFLLDVQDALLHPRTTPERVIWKAGTGVGKSAVVALAATFAFLRATDEKVIVTAPTEKQVRSVLMAEIRKHLLRGPEWLRSMMKIDLTKISMVANMDWQIMPITASEATSAQGQHGPRLVIFVEEVSGLDDEILDAFMRTLTQRGNAIVCVGNPNFRTGTLFRAFTTQAPFWPRQGTMNKFEAAAERPDLIDPEAIEMIRQEHGEDSFQWRVGVLGEFPLTDENSVMNIAHLRQAMATPKHEAIRQASNPWARAVSIDYARHGGDANVVATRAGNAVMDFHARYWEPDQSVHLAFQLQEQRGWSDESTRYIPDSIGIGQGLMALFDRAGKTVTPYGSNHKSPRVEYANAESMAWFQLRDLMARETVSLPNDPELFEQLSNRMYSYVPATMKLKVESKKEYKERTKQGSPDKADAIVQLFYDPERDDSPVGKDPSGQSEAQRMVLNPNPYREDREGIEQVPWTPQEDLWTFIG